MRNNTTNQPGGTRRRLGSLLMVSGLLLIVAAAALFLYNHAEDAAAGAASDEALSKIEAHIAQQEPEKHEFSSEMTSATIDGYNYLGYLSIPAIDRTLPVLADWNFDNLIYAPCRFCGSTKTDDLVIAGHNYTQHFGPLDQLNPNDEVYFTDMDGITTTYKVVSIETLMPTDVESMTSGESDLTLFTCTYSGTSRTTIRCNRAFN